MLQQSLSPLAIHFVWQMAFMVGANSFVLVNGAIDVVACLTAAKHTASIDQVHTCFNYHRH